MRSKALGVHGVAAARRERHVDRVAGALALADLVDVARARVERVLVRRHVEHVRVAQEHLLRAVAVVHVPVDHGDALEAARARVRGGDGHVVEQAEAHRLRRGARGGREGGASATPLVAGPSIKPSTIATSDPAARRATSTLSADT